MTTSRSVKTQDDVRDDEEVREVRAARENVHIGGMVRRHSSNQ